MCVIGHEFHEFHENDHCHLDVIGFEIQSFAVSPDPLPDSHFFYEACRCQAPSVVTTLPSVYLRAWWLAFLVRAVICPERTSIRADRQRSNTLSCIRSVANVVRVFSGRPHLISGSNRGKPQVQPGSPHLGSMFYSCCVSLGRMREVQHRSGTGVLNKPPHPTSLLPPFKGAKKPPNGTWGFLAP